MPSSNNRETTPSSVHEDPVVKMTVPKAAGKLLSNRTNAPVATVELPSAPDQTSVSFQLLVSCPIEKFSEFNSLSIGHFERSH